MMMMTTLVLTGALAVGEVAPGVEAAGHGRDWQANTFTRSRQSEAAVASLPDGGTIVVWSSRRQHGGRSGVYAQRFDAWGVAVGVETSLMLWDRGHQEAPAVDVSSSGVIWTAWMSYGQDGDAGAIMARSFRMDGDALVGGSEILVNDDTVGHQTTPAVVALADDEVAVLYTSRSVQDGRCSARWRWLDAEGNPTGPSQAFATPTGGGSQLPAGAATPDGFVGVYAVVSSGQRPASIHLQSVTRTGAAPAYTVVTDGVHHPIEPTVAVHADRALIGWLQLEGSRRMHRVASRTMDWRSGEGTPAQVRSAASGMHHQGVQAVALADGRFGLLWNAWDADGTTVRMSSLDVTSEVWSAERPAVSATSARAALGYATGARRAVARPDGGVVLAWSGAREGVDSSGVACTAWSATAWPASVRSGVQPGMPAVGMDFVASADGPSPHEPPTFDPERATASAERISALGTTTVGFDGIIDTGWDPPDPTMGVGPNHIVLMTNGGIAFLTKTGQVTFHG